MAPWSSGAMVCADNGADNGTKLAAISAWFFIWYAVPIGTSGGLDNISATTLRFSCYESYVVGVL